MALTLKTSRVVNRSLTYRVIELHKKGYTIDFFVRNKQLLCLQDNLNFGLGDVYIKVIDKVYDHFTHRFKYIHTIDTCNGEKGVMIIDSIFTNASA